MANIATNKTTTKSLVKLNIWNNLIAIDSDYSICQQKKNELIFFQSIQIADHDDRVVPLHSYKYIAQLQYQLGDRFARKPLLIRIDTGTGHGGAKPTDKIVNRKKFS